jgi:glucosamine-6-phosphate deaminase
MLRVFPSSEELAQAAALHAAQSLQNLLESREMVRLLVATGASQLRFLELLTARGDLDWKRVELFHLDEYVGIDHNHPASFARYIKERVIDPTGIVSYHLLDGAGNPSSVVSEMNALISGAPVDLAFAGIGENGHLAFNDPPADLETKSPYLIVDLDERCRQQQVGEGWFPSLNEVPRQAISISIQQLLQTKEIISVVPGKQKAVAVYACLTGEINALAPASALRMHQQTSIYLDRDSASLLPASETGSLS